MLMKAISLKVSEYPASTLVFLVIISSTFFLTASSNASARSIEYAVSSRPDGGFSVEIVYSKRHWKPITAEGMFPLDKKGYKIEVIGKGEDWTNRNQKGYYYRSDEITSDIKAWDLGYGWIDENRRYLYLNFFWVSSPDGLIPSDINGKYDLRKTPNNR